MNSSLGNKAGTEKYSSMVLSASFMALLFFPGHSLLTKRGNVLHELNANIQRQKENITFEKHKKTRTQRQISKFVF